MSKQTKIQPWIKNVSFDAWFILTPPFLALLGVALLPAELKSGNEMPLAGWILLILFIDVAHVYSTLFKTYFNNTYFNAQRQLFIWTPIICYVAGVLIYSIDGMLFWRILAYTAVFHFIRQQYGFMRLYSLHETKKNLSSKINTAAIYSATIYPIIYWHCTPGRNFTWFVEGDFLALNSIIIKQFALALYLAIITTYLLKEAWLVVKSGEINIPRNTVIIGTTVSWYFGIVYFNGDLAFTLLNVVSHGIPYMALIWINRRPSEVATTEKRKVSSTILSKNGLLFFISTIILLAYLEEGLWDGLIWKEHGSIFSGFSILPKVENSELLAILVPLLALPQLTHYILDGFIWRKQKA